jgi:pre-rRNA-processing protein TSR4
MCRDSKCCEKNLSRNFLAFRCQLARQNEFYSYDPPSDDENCLRPRAQDYVPVCVVCGVRGPKQCGKCHGRNYCSKAHQLIDWKTGHKEACTKDETNGSSCNRFLLPEFEVVTELEELEDEVKEKSDAERLEELKMFVKEKGESLVGEEDGTDGFLDDSLQDDKQYRKFAKRIKINPDQVLRYQRSGDPLWVSSENIPQSSDISSCPCGATRQFEFQILPQLLNHLGLDSVGDSIDWGTLAVYTCSASCDVGPAYHPEIVWKQDFSTQHPDREV